ncbi:hypothetical protein [Serratia entomophila]|uniref:hypothetical protein n=1 Tax=Serratia entomophila TaxID=42906 RepID=UPI001F4BF6B0|nr:hypothetical protein [Serratia entomophila]ULG11686.1 hypothetical protein 440p1_00070 [Serratia entomophila]ULG11718.1 hypothetical protein 442p_00028 [Serratia entomophila]CAI1172044.1 Uncharacterised protein [Serratia entomophila]CAI2006577.1 Uncharacterised protein [Serratia entomophila]CAI2525518.1 Uncharacterised protein [Serratia entomophila]
MMTEADKERFNMRVCVGELLVSADFYVNPVMTESAAEVKIVVPDSDYQTTLDLYDRLCQYALMHGEDLQSLFQTEKYKYISCFIHDVAAFKAEFESEDILRSLFNHGKGDTAEILISLPEELNYDGKSQIKNYFIDIIQKHVITIDEEKWQLFIDRAMTGQSVLGGINTKDGCDFNPDDSRENIIKLPRPELVKKNITDAFEPEYYVNSLLNDAEKIGEILGYSVWFNPNGFYFYWNNETEFLLESWLTFPAYPYGW